MNKETTTNKKKERVLKFKEREAKYRKQDEDANYALDGVSYDGEETIIGGESPSKTKASPKKKTSKEKRVDRE